MSIDWDADLLGPVMAIFGEGRVNDPSSWPIYYPASGGRLSLAGAVFDAQYLRVFTLEDGSSTSSQHPCLGVRASLFPQDPKVGDGVFIPSVGKTFRASDVQPDGHGHILLLLMETSL